MYNPRRFETTDVRHGHTYRQTYMEVTVIDDSSGHDDKRVQVLTKMYEIDGDEPLFKLYDLKSALRQQTAGLRTKTLYIYKGLYNNHPGVIDTNENSPHNLANPVDVLGDDDLVPQTWTFYLITHNHPEKAWFHCYIEPHNQWIKLQLPTQDPPTCGQLKSALENTLWNMPFNHNFRFAARYLSQIQVQDCYTGKRLKYNTALHYDPAAILHNRFYIWITDNEGRRVPKGHCQLTGDQPNMYPGARNGHLPLLHKTVDCSFEYPIYTARTPTVRPSCSKATTHPPWRA